MRQKWSLSLSLFLVLASWSVSAETIKSIKLENNVRIEAATIFDRIKSKEETPLSQDQVTKDVKALFETGFFYGITVDWTKGVLTYSFEEKPAIKEIELLGNRAFSDEELTEVHKLEINQILDIKKVNTAIDEIQKKYEEKGYFLAKIRYETRAMGKGNSKLTFRVKEGDKVKIREVQIIGNSNLSDEKLKSVMASKAVGLFGMGGSFRKEALKRDQEVLRFLYLDQGYARVQVSPPAVSMTPDKRGLKISFNINEGKKYKIGKVIFSGDLLFSESELLDEIQVDDQEYFSQSKLLRDISKLQAKYGDEGYAYANIVPAPRVAKGTDVMNILFKVSKGEKVYIGEINMKGNSKTRDKVIRRELRLYEGELFNETAKRKSLANVRRLGFFDNVELQPKSSSEESNLMNLDVVVAERSTGQLNLGAGYTGTQGFVLQGSIQQTNFLGKGINLGANINWSTEREQLFNINLTEPYFRDSNWSLGVDAYKSIIQFDEFRELKTGGGLRAGRRFGDYLQTIFRFKIDDVEVELDGDAFADVFTPQRVRDAEGIASTLTATLQYDRRNDRRFPTKGYFASLGIEQAGLGGDLNFTKVTGNVRYYKPLFGSLVWRHNLNYGWVASTDGDPPFNELFRIGGPNTIRGYDFFSIAKKERSELAFQSFLGAMDPFAEEKALIPFGGRQQLYYNMEFQWALVKEAGINGVVFFDIGDADDGIDFTSLESSLGFGVRWISPLGPLRFEWAFPINPREELGEREWDFDFSIISSF